MPSSMTQKSSSCCIGGDPPSPDGPAARPASSSVKVERRESKDHIPSWTTSDAAQLQAIFEEDTSTPVTKERNKTKGRLRTIFTGDLSQTHHDFPLEAVQTKGKSKFDDDFLADKPDTDDERDSELEEVKRKKSSSTLKAVTKRLKKHFSRESALNKRLSRSSVGTSDEEIERRAELKRIRERRIREELSNEGLYDDDAKSMSSLAGPSSDKKRPKSWIPGIYLPLPPLTFDPIAEALKAIQFQHPFQNLASTDTLVEHSGTLSRRHSSPILPISPDIGTPRGKVYIPSRKPSSLPPMPPTPLLEPTRISSISELPTSSWRLSFASENRGEHLRKLSQEHSVPVTLSTDKLKRITRPTRHLHRIGLRATSQYVTASEGSVIDDLYASRAQTCSASKDFGGVDGSDGDTAIHLHEMGISQRLASRMQSTSSPQLSSWGSDQRHASSDRGVSNAIRAERARYMQNTSESTPLSEQIPLSWGQVLHGSSSSMYPSGSNSLQASRESMGINMSPLPQDSRPNITADECKELVRTSMMSPLMNVSTDSISVSELGLPLARYARRATMDDSSVAVSETSSFRRMEAELSVVESRFASSEARRIPSTPVSSKFREEFDELPEPNAAETTKRSAFSRLARLAIRSHDGARDIEELLNVPMPDFQPKVDTTSAGLGPLDDKEVAGLWGQAIKKKDGGNQVRSTRKESIQGSRKKSMAEEEAERPKGAFEGILHRRKGKKKADTTDHKSAAEEYQKKFEERVAVKELVMDSWEAEMEASAQRAKAKSRNIVKKNKPTAPDHRYPASWSRFPSHNRDERISSASAVDRVETKDFANLGKKDGEIVWCLAHEDDGHHTELEYLKQRKGFTQKIKERLAEEVYRNDTEIQQQSSSKGRRGSLTVAGELEFPELEVMHLTSMLMMNSADAEKEFAERERKMKLMKATVDGVMDSDDDDDELEMSRMSIADPKFYEDCLVDNEDNDVDMLEEMLPKTRTGSKTEKYRTWAGRDWDGYKLERRNRNMSLGSVFLRRSTDDHCVELEVLEKVERERVLKAADDAWGRRK